MKLVQRIGYVVDFLSINPENDSVRFSFVREHLLSLIGCSHLSAWQLNSEGTWELLAESSACPELPESVADWQSLNQDVAAHHQFQTQPIECGGHLWSQAVSTRNGVTLVAHLCIVDPKDEFVADLTDISLPLLVTLKPAKRRSGMPAINGGLSERQWQVLELITQGKTYGQIAAELGYSESLIKQEGALICRRLGVKSRYDAADYYRKHVQS